MNNVLRIYTDASTNSTTGSFMSFVAITEDTHVMSRVYPCDTKNIYEAERAAAIAAIREIPIKPYKQVIIYIDNQSAVYSIRAMCEKKTAPFDKFDNITVEKITAHQTVSNPNKIADMLASAGRCYYDNGVQPRAVYHMQYPSRVAKNTNAESHR